MDDNSTLAAAPGGTPAPPPPMPVVVAKQAAVVTAPGTAAPADVPAGMPAQPEARTGGWAVDGDRLNTFLGAINEVRDRLSQVQTQVDAMRSDSYTPKLGTSPVATQLEQKFADRLDAPLDNPAHPTSGGLRPMLAEAIQRMQTFVESAELAAKNYQEHDTDAAGQIHHGHHHRGG